MNLRLFEGIFFIKQVSCCFFNIKSCNFSQPLKQSWFFPIEVPVKTDGDLGMQDLPCDDEAESGKNIASCGNLDAVQTERGKEANGDKLGIQKKQESMGSDGTGVKQLNGKAKKEMIQYKDLYESFTPDLAHYSYVLFCRVLGDHFVADILYNADLIWQLCSFVDEGLTLTGNNETVVRSDSGKQKEEEKCNLIS